MFAVFSEYIMEGLLADIVWAACPCRKTMPQWSDGTGRDKGRTSWQYFDTDLGADAREAGGGFSLPSTSTCFLPTSWSTRRLHHWSSIPAKDDSRHSPGSGWAKVHVRWGWMMMVVVVVDAGIDQVHLTFCYSLFDHRYKCSFNALCVCVCGGWFKAEAARHQFLGDRCIARDTHLNRQ